MNAADLLSWLQAWAGVLTFAAILLYAPTLILLTRAINKRVKAFWPLLVVTENLTPRQMDLLARFVNRQLMGDPTRPGSGIIAGEEERIKRGWEAEP